MSRSVVLLTLASLAAMAAGLLREVVVARLYGTTAPADALAVVLYYTDSFAAVLLAGLVAFMLVPALAPFQVAGRQTEGYSLLNSLLAWMGMLTLPVGLVSVLWPAAVAGLIAPDFSAEQRALLLRLLPAGGLTLLVLAFSTLLTGALQTAERYSLPTLSRGLLGLGIALGVGLGASRWGIAVAGWGLLAGATAQLAWLALALWRVGWRPGWPKLRHPALPGVVAAGLPVLVTLILAQWLVGGAQRALASSLPEGSLAAVNYAHRALNLMTSVSVAIGTVSLTELALQYNQPEAARGMRRLMENSLQGTLFIFLPLSVLFVVLAEPLIVVLFQRGQYDAAALRLTAECLRWYALSGVAGALSSVFFRAFPAVRRPWRVVAVGTLNGAANLLTTVGLLRAGVGVLALPIGYGVGMTVACLVGAIGLTDVFGVELWRALGRYGLKITALTVAAGIALLVVEPLARALPWGSWLSAMAQLALGAAVFGAVYGGLALVTREPQAARLWQGAARRLARREAAAGD